MTFLLDLGNFHSGPNQKQEVSVLAEQERGMNLQDRQLRACTGAALPLSIILPTNGPNLPKRNVHLNGL